MGYISILDIISIIIGRNVNDYRLLLHCIGSIIIITMIVQDGRGRVRDSKKLGCDIKEKDSD